MIHLLLMVVLVRAGYFPRARQQVSSSIKVAKVRPSFRNRPIQTVPRVRSSLIPMGFSLHR